MGVGQPERNTQDRIIDFLVDELGYEYLGNFQDDPPHENVEEEILRDWLKSRGVSDAFVQQVIHDLDKARQVGGERSLYKANAEVYEKLRYGIGVKPSPGANEQTIPLVAWGENWRDNRFHVAEEVPVAGVNDKRPDVVLYVNGIAVAVLELKRSTISVSEGIRQNLDNQQSGFIRDFFSTMQLVMAGNDSQGLHYGTIETPEVHYTQWKELNPSHDPSDPASEKYLPAGRCATSEHRLDCDLARLVRPKRMLELIHDFVVFDSGTKKIARHNQYFGVKAAREKAERKDDGIIWHAQGSGKSLTMVWLARWIKEHDPNARVLIITDRTELDEQIEGVFQGVGEDIARIRNGKVRDRQYSTGGEALIDTLQRSDERLMSSLVHKFGCGEGETMDEYVEDVKANLPPDFDAKGDFFVFVDEAHRTQSGKLHEAMQTVLPNATFFGFTGTPLLKKDKKRTIEVFGPYIHTYKFDEAVDDDVVLDLLYEARDVDQEISSPDKVDQWFETKTQGLSDRAKDDLKQRWGTMKQLLSSQDRLQKIVSNIVMDMNRRDRLQSGRGNAILVADSIFSACRYYELFNQTELNGKCAVVTSYRPSPSDVKGEETGMGQTQDQKKYEVYRQMLADHFEVPKDEAMNRADEFEEDVKDTFVEHPGQMKFLIVVDKLLTGFDAPPATYLYVDKKMQDHSLFQAICRVNRLDGEDKDYGYIVDYMDLFKAIEGAVDDYTGAAFEGYDEDDVKGLLKDRIEQGRKRLEETRERLKALCEPVEPPKEEKDYIRYFCGEDPDDEEQLKENERKRHTLYEYVSSFVRAYANLANDMDAAGYSPEEVQEIKDETDHFENVRRVVKLASSDYVDLKAFEPAMRHLLDTYVDASESEVMAQFDDLGLVERIAKHGITALDDVPEGVQGDEEAMAETIENNVRKVIVDRRDANPSYYDRMSKLLQTLIQKRREEALEYKEYLEEVAELSKKVVDPSATDEYPDSLHTPGQRALYDNLREDEDLARQVDQKVQSNKKDNWRGDEAKERDVKRAVYEALEEYDASPNKDDVEDTFNLIKSHTSEY
jgi:type I restriction enzyme R subunit